MPQSWINSALWVINIYTLTFTTNTFTYTVNKMMCFRDYATMATENKRYVFTSTKYYLYTQFHVYCFVILNIL